MQVASLVREQEEASQYTHHDHLFKELIHTFFEEFLEVFFPEVHGYVDFQDIKPLSEEVFADLHDGVARRLDIVMETKLKGEETVLIIHVHPQSFGQTNFHERMYHYFSMLYNKYRKPILPIAVFSYDEKRHEKSIFVMDFPFFHVLTFNFLMLELRKKNWRDYIKSDNPAAAALLSKMGYNEDEKVQVKLEFYRMMARMELAPARQRLIYGFFERYLLLSEKEEEALMKEIEKSPDMEKIMELPISYEEKGKEKGRQEGKREEKQEIALEMLRKGLSINLISEVTHLEKEEIEQLEQLKQDM